MPKRSAGLLLHRAGPGGIEFLLVHPGGPFWRRRDAGAWSIPKGEIEDGEAPEAAARREFEEETGWTPPAGAFLFLGEIRQAGGKVVAAFAAKGDADPATLRSNVFETVWPPRSGQLRSFPEIDRAGWFGLGEARVKLLPAQAVLPDRLLSALGAAPGS